VKLNKLISSLFRVVRFLIDFKAVASGDPKKIIRRAKNKFIGKKIIRRFW